MLAFGIILVVNYEEIVNGTIYYLGDAREGFAVETENQSKMKWDHEDDFYHTIVDVNMLYSVIAENDGTELRKMSVQDLRMLMAAVPRNKRVPDKNSGRNCSKILSVLSLPIKTRVQKERVTPIFII